MYRMQKLAKELGVVIPVSFFEEANNAHYNSIAIIDADGADLGLYRKSHIPDGPGIWKKEDALCLNLFCIIRFSVIFSLDFFLSSFQAIRKSSTLIQGTLASRSGII